MSDTSSQESSSNELAGVNALFASFNVQTANYPDKMTTAKSALIELKNPGDFETVSYNGNQYSIPSGFRLEEFKGAIILHENAQGNSLSSYSSSLAKSIGISGSYGALSGSVSVSYGYEESVVNETFYETYMDEVRKYSLAFPGEDIDLDGTDDDKPYKVSKELIDAFSALETDDSGQNGVDFFAKWGTHYINGIHCGGHCVYSMYGSSTSFSSLETFSKSAEVKYGLVSGTAEATKENETKAENVESNGKISIIGGSDSAASAVIYDKPSHENFVEWVDSITGNEEWYGFMEDGLTAIYELCTNETKRKYLKNVLNQMLGINVPVPSKKAEHESVMSWKDSPGADEGDYYVEVDDKRNGSNTRAWSAFPNEVLVGIGGYVNSNYHLTKMVLVTLNLTTGDYTPYYPSGKDSTSDAKTKFQAFGMAPQGCVITGFGITEKSHTIYKLIIYYQKLNLNAQPNEDGKTYFLDNNVEYIQSIQEKAKVVSMDSLPFGKVWSAKGGSKYIEDLTRVATPVSNPSTQNFIPPMGNQKIIQAIEINSSSTSKPHYGFDYLFCEFSELVL